MVHVMIREILEKFAKGEITLHQAEKELKLSIIEDLEGMFKFDLNRESRKGIPEIVLAEGKNCEDLLKAVHTVMNMKNKLIVSRLNKECAEKIRSNVKERYMVEFNEKGRIMVIKKRGIRRTRTNGKIAIVTAGTSDIPVAEEARIIAEEMGCEALTFYDVGVSGLHRLFPVLKKIIDQDTDVLVVVAGREGALPTVIAGLIDIPIIAVPTSTGYGYGGRGKGALSAMLQACPLGIAVVNIDAGVAAGAIAALIANRSSLKRHYIKEKSSGN